MTDPENLALIRGFLLGMRVTQHVHGIESGGAPEHAVLRELASGELTLQTPPNELQQRLPGLPAQVAERFADRMREAKLAERRDAKVILAFLPGQTP